MLKKSYICDVCGEEKGELQIAGEIVMTASRHLYENKYIEHVCQTCWQEIMEDIKRRKEEGEMRRTKK